MICDKKNKPVMTAEQISECRMCMHASEKKVWCCLLGCWIKEQAIITTSNKVIPKHHKSVAEKPKPTLPQMAENFAKAMIKWGGSGFKTVDKETYIKRRQICSACVDGWRCPHCGCMLWAKVALTTEKCPENKW